MFLTDFRVFKCTKSFNLSNYKFKRNVVFYFKMIPCLTKISTLSENVMIYDKMKVIFGFSTLEILNIVHKKQNGSHYFFFADLCNFMLLLGMISFG